MFGYKRFVLYSPILSKYESIMEWINYHHLLYSKQIHLLEDTLERQLLKKSGRC